MESQYLREHIELLSGTCQKDNKNRRHGYCPGTVRQEKDIWEVNPPNSGLEMYGKESRAIVKTACEDCLVGSVGHGFQEELGLQEQYSPGRDAS